MRLSRVHLLVVSGSIFINPVAAQDTNSQPASYESNLTITGKEPGPYNIRVQVQPPTQLVNLQKQTNSQANKPADKPVDPPSAQTTVSPLPPTSPVNLGSLFPALFGGDESHHHGPDGKDVPFVSLDAPLVDYPPTIDFPYLPGLPPRYDDPGYQCYNYVYEQLTGVRSTRAMNAGDVTNLLNSFARQTYKPGSPLPMSFPPGTILLFAGHVGIVGSDGHTVFNFTKKSDENNLPATLHKTPSAYVLWNHTNPDPPKPKPIKLPNEGFLDRFIGPSHDPVNRTQGNQPYANSPVQVFTPPQR